MAATESRDDHAEPKAEEASEKSPPSVFDHETPNLPLNARTWTIFCALAVLSFTISLEAAVLVPVLPSIASALHGSTSSTLWAGSSYLLTVAVFQPLIGALSEEFGHQTLLLGSIALFNIGVLVCSLSHQMTAFLVGRSIQGLGGGGILALINIIPTAMASLRQRPTAIMLNQVGYAAGAILGPVLGGIIGQYTTWRWIFYLNFPLCGVTIPILVFGLEGHGSAISLREQFLRLDYIGAVLFLSSACSLLIGIIWGGEQYPWRSWQTLLPIFCGVVGIIATLAWEAYLAPRPFLCLSLFRVRAASAVYLGTCFQGFVLFCQLYYLPVYFEGVRGYSIASTGLAFLPVTGAMIVGSLGSGSLIHNTARLRWIIIAGWTLALVSTGMLFVFNRTTQTYKWVLILLLVGLGHGTLIVSLNYALQVLAEGRQVAHAMSMYTFLRSFGMCLGVAAGSSLLQNALRSQSSQSSSATALMDVMNLATHPELPPALLISFRYTCAVMTGVAIAGLVLSFVYAVSSSDVRNR